MRLTGRIAFTTGSSRGIGAAIAKRLAADGAKVVLHASKAGKRVADRVARWTALRRIGAPGDIADIVAFLASDDARWSTGVTLAATGGQITSITHILAKGSPGESCDGRDRDPGAARSPR